LLPASIRVGWTGSSTIRYEQLGRDGLTMREKNEPVPEPPLEAPNAGELDVYSVLWAERQGDNQPLQLSEVARRVSERRRAFNEPEPALTTVSTHLRALVRKGLAEEVLGASTAARPAIRTRGGFTPPTRSPLTSYRALHSPGEVLRTTYRGLATAYPERLDALVDFARAVEMSAEGLRQLQKLVEQEKARGS
jgi:predicted transcriptional regulator